VTNTSQEQGFYMHATSCYGVQLLSCKMVDYPQPTCHFLHGWFT